MTDEQKKQCALDIMKTGALDWSKKLNVIETVEGAKKYLKDNNVDIDSYIEEGTKTIQLNYGATATVDNNCSQQTIDALNQLVEKTFINGVYCKCEDQKPFYETPETCSTCFLTVSKNIINYKK